MVCIGDLSYKFIGVNVSMNVFHVFAACGAQAFSLKIYYGFNIGPQGLKLTLIPRSDFLLLLSKSWSKSDRHRSYFLSFKADIWLDWVAKLCS